MTTAIHGGAQACLKRGQTVHGFFDMPTPVYHPDDPVDWDPSKEYPPEALKAEFGRRLQLAMTRRGWSQSELARRAAIGRDSVSVYIRGRSLPGFLHLDALCKALGLTRADLMPEVMQRSSARVWTAGGVSGSPLEMRLQDDGRIWMRFSTAVTVAQAIAVLRALDPKGEALADLKAGRVGKVEPEPENLRKRAPPKKDRRLDRWAAKVRSGEFDEKPARQRARKGSSPKRKP